MTDTIHQLINRVAPEYGHARVKAAADALVRLRTQAPNLDELDADEQRFWLRDARAAIDAAGLAGLMRELSQARHMERVADRHALAAEKDAAQMAAALANRDATIATLTAQDTARAVEAYDLETRLAEAQTLIGETGQPGWDNVTRAEAIRQAEAFHTAMLRWAADHNDRRAERDSALDVLRRLAAAVTDENAPPEVLAGVLAEARQVGGRPPQAGDRLVDGGQMGTLTTCDTCSGLGLLHQLDEPATLTTEEPRTNG
ncbi:hypothetical protein ABZ671_00650 [Micromonospora sp. NPDC006766]|uniref:hypothetical protein n=1 Tax=Micromonospora sp. NPDC006766 TaxID=3154778 RepID=UPI0033D3FCEE